MITPVGNIRRQENQGIFKNESIWNDSLRKIAVTGTDIQDPTPKMPTKMPTDVPGDLQQAMNEGNSSSMRGNVPGMPERMPGEREAPTGTNPPQAKSPASRFLGANPNEGNETSTQLMLRSEEQKVRKFIGNDFGLKMSLNKDGSVTVSITPPHQRPITDPTAFIQEFIRSIGGMEQKEVDSPPAREPGAITISYLPQALHKVQKR